MPVLSMPSPCRVRSNRKTSTHSSTMFITCTMSIAAECEIAPLGFLSQGCWNQHRASPAWSCGPEYITCLLWETSHSLVPSRSHPFSLSSFSWQSWRALQGHVLHLMLPWNISLPTSELQDRSLLKDRRTLPSGLGCQGNIFLEKMDNKRDLIIQGDYIPLSDPLSLLLHTRNWVLNICRWISCAHQGSLPWFPLI